MKALLCRSSRDSREDREFYQAKTVKTHSNNLVVLAHVQLKPFYRLSTHDVTHVRKCTRPSPAFPYCKRREAGWGPGNEANFVACFEYSLFLCQAQKMHLWVQTHTCAVQSGALH